MTIEEAIQWMHKTKIGRGIMRDKDAVDACDMAIAALRAQLEREQVDTAPKGECAQ